MVYILLQEASGKLQFVKPKGKLRIGKQWVKLDQLKQLEYNKLYEVDRGDIIPSSVETAGLVEELTGGNKEFFDDNTAQALSGSEVVALKAERGGHEVIDRLVEGSSTFALKTQFAQEKYLKKKQAKHLNAFKMLRPTSHSIAEALYILGYKRSLRPDILANMVTLSNVNFHRKPLITDQVQGLLIGTFLQRTGQSVHYFREVGKFKALDYFNLTREDRLRMVPFEENSAPFDCMIVAQRNSPLEFLQQHVGSIRGSGHIVLHSHELSWLGECQDWLLSQSLAVDVQIDEIWTREYQVLPDRTHPLMGGPGFSGYVLSGIKVVL
jgi:tRNA (adenine-N(1)-)-methyltransferase non-catalytic subunit